MAVLLREQQEYHFTGASHWRILLVIPQNRVIDDSLKRQIKSRTLGTIRLFLPTYIFQYTSNWSKVFQLSPSLFNTATYIASSLERNFFHDKENNFSVNQVGLHINWANTSLFIILGKLPTLNQSHPSLRQLFFLTVR